MEATWYHSGLNFWPVTDRIAQSSDRLPQKDMFVSGSHFPPGWSVRLVLIRFTGQWGLPAGSRMRELAGRRFGVIKINCQTIKSHDRAVSRLVKNAAEEAGVDVGVPERVCCHRLTGIGRRFNARSRKLGKRTWSPSPKLRGINQHCRGTRRSVG